MHEFEKERKHAGKKRGLKKGDKETFRRRVYLHIYFNPIREYEEKAQFDKSLVELKENIEGGATQAACRKARKTTSKSICMCAAGATGHSCRSTRALARKRRSRMAISRLSQTVRRILSNASSSTANGLLSSHFSSPATSGLMERDPGCGTRTR